MPTLETTRRRRNVGRATAAAFLSLVLIGCNAGKGDKPAHTPGPSSGGTVTYRDSPDRMHAGVRQTAHATGASVRLSQERPKQVGKDEHSLMELSIESADGNQVVEVGWIVYPELYGDSLPHLFAYHWVDGFPSCYPIAGKNECGFKQTSSKIKVGQAVQVGKTATYGIQYDSGANQWQVSYNNEEVGNFPGSLWQGTFTVGEFEQAFGEISSPADKKCVDMGNGNPGATSTKAATISNFALTGSATSAPHLSLYQPNASLYSVGGGANGMYYVGGPGAC